MDIDSMDRAEIIAACEKSGLAHHKNTKTDALRILLKDHLNGDSSEVVAAPAPIVEDSTDPNMKLVKIIIDEDENTDTPVTVTLNSRNYIMQRGQEVSVPKAVVMILDNAVFGKVDPKTGRHRDIKRFPYSVVS